MNTRARRLPCALAIGGIDPGGGAGVIADLRAFAAAGAFGCAAVAVITVQSTAGLRQVRAVPAKELTAQALEVLVHQRVRAIKVGALGTAENARAVGRILAGARAVPAVVDTPIRPTAGKGRLLAERAIAALRDDVVPRATVLTVNTEEAGILLGTRVETSSQARDAARGLLDLGPRAVLVKGGHLSGPTAIDVVALGESTTELRAPRLPGGPVHGTGCTFASLVAGRLATRGPAAVSGQTIVEALRWAKRTHHQALSRAATVGRGARVLVWTPDD